MSLGFLMLGRALRSFSQAYLGVVVPLYLLARGADATAVGLVVTVWSVGAVVLGVLGGFLADRFGRRFVLMLFSVCNAVCALAFVFNEPIWALAIAGALGTIGRGGGPAAGGAYGPYFSAEQALVAEHASANERTKIFARLSFFGALAGAGGFAVASVLHHPAFWIAVLAGGAMTLSVLPVHEAAHNRVTRARRVPLSPPTKAILLRLAITNATNGMAVEFLGPMLVLWFHVRFHASTEEIARMYLIIALASTLAYPFVPRVVRAIGGAVRTVVFLRLFSCVLLAVMPLLPSLWLAGVCYLIRMIFNSVTLPVRQSYTMGVVSASERSRVASLSNVPSQMFSMLGPTIAGIIIRELWIGTMLELASFFQLLNAALYWRFFHHRPPPEERA